MYWGKIIGTLAGLATLKPALALLGLILGHQFDRGYARRYGAQGHAQGHAQGYAQGQWDNIAGKFSEGFLEALFGTMGHLAKSDGRVSEDEIRAARAVMYRLGLRPGQTRRAIDWFDAGKSPVYPLERTIRALRRGHARRQETRRLFLRLLLEVSLAKHRLHPRERSLIWTVCTGLDIGRVELAQLEAMIRAQKGFRRSPAGSADTERVKTAYRTLGVAETADNDEVKRAYRRLMNRNHPDKIAASDPDTAEIEAAQRKTREIRAAYELLKARRAIR